MSNQYKYPYKEYHKTVNDIEYKKCTTHKNYFPEEDEWMPCNKKYFYVNKKNSLDGLHPECKKCTKAKMGTWRKNNVNKYRRYNRNAYRQNKWGIQESVKARTNQRNIEGKYKEWLKSEIGKQKSKEYNKKRRNKNHVIYETEWKSCKKFFNNSCAYCGLHISKHFHIRKGILKLQDLHKEHVIDDGKNDLRNCIPACESCNSSKNTKTINKWYNINNPNYTYERYLKIYQWLRYDYKKYIMPKRRYKGQHLIQRLKEIESNKFKNVV